MRITFLTLALGFLASVASDRAAGQTNQPTPAEKNAKLEMVRTNHAVSATFTNQLEELRDLTRRSAGRNSRNSERNERLLEQTQAL